jgi:hypothetical protein
VVPAAIAIADPAAAVPAGSAVADRVVPAAIAIADPAVRRAARVRRKSSAHGRRDIRCRVRRAPRAPIQISRVVPTA